MSAYHRCPKCASDQMMDGAFISDATTERLVVGVDRHPDLGPLPQKAATQLHASVCGSCGFVELYANQPAELYQAYRRAVKARGD